MNKDVKIVINSICKNEIKNVERWVNCCRTTDLIYVLDTGSDDGTVEYLREHGVIVDVDTSFTQEGIFNFGRARNACLNNARAIVKERFENNPIIYVSIDLDEFITDGSIENLRSLYDSSFDSYKIQCFTNGAYSSVSHKVISDDPDWRWIRSIHETTYLGRTPNVCPTIGLTYEHVQDLSKDRNYFECTKYAYEQEPNNSLNCVYYGWECYNRGEYDLFKRLNEEYLEVLTNNEEDIYYQNTEHIICGCLNLVTYYTDIEINPTMALVYSDRIERIVKKSEFPRFRRHYWMRALTFKYMRQFKAAELCLTKCLEIQERPYCFVDDDYFYNNDVIEEELKGVRESISKQQNEVNKICVYAICRNEKQFVEKWLESMSEADYIVVLDTGSTDGTYEMLKEDPRVYRCEQKVITPWRFDVARNEGMLLIPDDANILLSTDLDELLEPGWAQVIRDKWNPQHHVRGDYKYAWSHNENGEPGRIFYYDKLHDRNWYWGAPVHELLFSELYDYSYRYSHEISLFNDGVYLHHYPDYSKSRSTYLPLLQLRAKENPEDYYGLYYLSHEYFYQGMYEKCIEIENYILTNFSEQYELTEKAAAYLFLGDSYRALGDNDKSVYYYNIAIGVDDTYREPYLSIAEIMNEKQMYDVAIGYVQEALKKTYRHYTWVERDNSWGGQIEDILSVSYYWTGDYKKSFECVTKAIEYFPNDGRIKYNFDIISKALQENVL